jgi:uncharacterized protein YodC (DUF2158 family)
MKEPKYKEGEWVKEKNGTQGMTVVENVVDSVTSDHTGEVRCRFKNSTGQEVESNFWEDDLLPL